MKPWLITGGTGTLGHTLVPHLLKHKEQYGFSRLRILSRCPQRQEEMAAKYPSEYIDYFVGDVRDVDRLLEASENCYAMFHFAAFKHVDKCEYDPWESILTNVVGTKNAITAAKRSGVRKCVFTSSDKAVSPLNVYGAGKLCAEKLWIAGNIGANLTRFSCVRYGNVLGSNSSVLTKWEMGPPYTVTDPNMTRFFMTPEAAVDLVLYAFLHMRGGEIFIPEMQSTTIGDLLEVAVDGADDIQYIGIRPGEKIHECLINEDESRNVTRVERNFVLWPTHRLFQIEKTGEKVSPGAVTSLGAQRFHPQELREMISGK